MEPVGKFIEEGYTKACAGEWVGLDANGAKEKGRGAGRGKRVWFVKGGLQQLDPMYPAKEGKGLGVVGNVGSEGGQGEEGFGKDEGAVRYDV
jgi:protein N-terminal methyltransferase